MSWRGISAKARITCRITKSIVVASTATGWQNGEGPILRYVFFHSIALAVLVGLLVMLQAYVWPFTALVVH